MIGDPPGNDGSIGKYEVGSGGGGIILVDAGGIIGWSGSEDGIYDDTSGTLERGNDMGAGGKVIGCVVVGIGAPTDGSDNGDDTSNGIV